MHPADPEGVENALAYARKRPVSAALSLCARGRTSVAWTSSRLFLGIAPVRRPRRAPRHLPGARWRPGPNAPPASSAWWSARPGVPHSRPVGEHRARAARPRRGAAAPAQAGRGESGGRRLRATVATGASGSSRRPDGRVHRALARSGSQGSAQGGEGNGDNEASSVRATCGRGRHQFARARVKANVRIAAR